MRSEYDHLLARLRAKDAMLDEAAKQFAFYAEQHNGKVAKFESDLNSGIDDGARALVELSIKDTQIKATVNDGFAARCAAARDL